jgi:hypothetical protein
VSKRGSCRPGRQARDRLPTSALWSCTEMDAANSFKIERYPDHFIVRLGVTANPETGETWEEVASVLLPLTTALTLAVALFENVQKATPELQQAFEALQPKINALNVAGATKP